MLRSDHGQAQHTDSLAGPCTLLTPAPPNCLPPWQAAANGNGNGAAASASKSAAAVHA